MSRTLTRQERNKPSLGCFVNATALNYTKYISFPAVNVFEMMRMRMIRTYTWFWYQDESPFLQRKSSRSAAGGAGHRRRAGNSNNDVRAVTVSACGL